MNFDEFKAYLEKAAEDGTLLTPKHDPGNLAQTWATYRTVLSPDLAKNLEAFIKSGSYTVNYYEDWRPNVSGPLFEITPTDPNFNVPGSGIASQASAPHAPCDRLIAVSGSKQGWHLFADNAAEIEKRAASNQLQFKSPLT